MPVMTRVDLQAIAQEKIDDAQFLLSAGRPSNAYYLAGYAVEIGLKACIARQFTADAIPDRKLVNDVHIHDLAKLVGLAGLTGGLLQTKATNAQFGINWAIVVAWAPEMRYGITNATTAQDMVAAVNDGANGILPWIRAAW